MQLRDHERFFSQVDAQHVRPLACHGVGQDATATTDVEHAAAAQWRDAVNPVQSQRIDRMQGGKLTLDVPPAVRQ